MGWGCGSPSPAKTLTFPVSSCIPSSFSATPATAQVSSGVYPNFLKSWGDMVWNTFLFLRRFRSQELCIFKNALSTHCLPLPMPLYLLATHSLFEVLPTYYLVQIFKGSCWVDRENVLLAFTFWRDFRGEVKANTTQGWEFQKLRLKSICSLQSNWKGSF